MLIKSITNYCPKIKELSAYLIPNDFIYVKSLLIRCKYLMLLLGLSEPVDNLLTDIRIVNWECSIDALKRFFESCRERTLFYFGFLDDTKDIITKNHEMIIRKYFIVDSIQCPV